MQNNSNIKSMKLYNYVNRIYNEIKELGKNDSDPLQVDELTNFDQLHYHGVDALDYAIEKIGINSDMRILEIGSGIGGPARYIANKTGAVITALELQTDQNKVALDLTKRCGLSEKIENVCGDFLSYDFKDKKFDAIVSWLTLYHIPDQTNLLQKCFESLNSKGFFYAEDLFSRKPFTEDELNQISKEMYGNCLPDLEKYKSQIENAGLNLIDWQDMSDSWTKFTQDRFLSYKKNKSRHLRVHGKHIYESMNSFYTFMNNIFTQGKLGGIRIFAKKQ